ncbi:hypothetical protein PanWU01x14_110950 [Parasponia andersonii]|uniref:Uncharacterized protein n=1 Tax=Parasponia andersonii TaxID=3476 RepID=A0A2P5CYW0_PARAD|nr:hypothetical protein PanWU01x14_110950 [Parasponia andersonii]
MVRIIEHYFNGLFLSSNPTTEAIKHDTSGIEVRVSNDMNAHLTSDYSVDEIESAFFSSNPDSFHALFLRIRAMDGRLIWHFSKDGTYSVKTNYKEALETTIHVLVSCQAAKEVCWNSWFWPKMLNRSWRSFVDWAMEMKNSLSKIDLETWYILAWMLWGEKNDVVRGHHPKTASRILEDAELWLLEFKSLYQHVRSSTSSYSTSLSWALPRLNELKLNVDTAVNDSDEKMRTGLSFEILMVLFME